MQFSCHYCKKLIKGEHKFTTSSVFCSWWCYKKCRREVYKNLFGEPDNFKDKPISSGIYQRWKDQHCYRKTFDNKNCGSCSYSDRYEYHNKYYWKCRLMGISRSEATDIRKSYICNLYKEEIIKDQR